MIILDKIRKSQKQSHSESCWIYEKEIHSDNSIYKDRNILNFYWWARFNFILKTINDIKRDVYDEYIKKT